MTELDRASLDRLLPASSGPADWDDVLTRAGARDGRRRMVVLAIAVLAVAVGSASALAVHAFFIDRGFIGIPPEGATPSAPPTGRLVLSAYGLGDVMDRQGYLVNRIRGQLWVYADGRLITVHDGRLPGGANAQSTGLIERRLSPEGLELLRSTVLATGLFDRSRTVYFDYGPCWNFIGVQTRGRPVRLTWMGIQCLDGRHHVPEATPREARELRRLASLLIRPESWLPASAWAVRDVRAYVPRTFELWYGPWSLEAKYESVLNGLPRRAREMLQAKTVRRVRQVAGPLFMPVPAYAYRYTVTTAEARSLRRALAGAGVEVDRRSLEYVLSYRIGAGHQAAGALTLTFVPILPHGEPQGLGG